MDKFIFKRVLAIIPLMIAVVFLVFALMDAIPSSPGRIILGITAKQEDVDKLNEELGYNDPFLVRFFRYISGILTRFDFGTSYASRKSVAKEVVSNFRYTFRFTMLGVFVYVLIGIPMGVLSAVKQYSVADNAIRVTAMLLASFPNFWLYMLGILIFSLKLRWLPSNGVSTPLHYVLPVGLFAISAAAGLARTTRTTMLESIRQDYVRTARAKGASERTVIWKHAFKNAMLPIINSIGMHIAIMLGGTLIIESIFAMPGLGNVAYVAIQNRDVPLVMGVVIFLSFIFCIMVLLVDVVSAFVDPRVKAKYAG